MEKSGSVIQGSANRRTFLKNGMVAAGAATVGAGLLGREVSAFDQEDEKSGKLTRGDAAILRFLAAAEILETDLWVQYNELGGIQDSEVPGGSGSPPYTAALQVLDSDMPQYIHDNTEDEFTHENFINAYLASKGADIVDLEEFRTLQGSAATGASGKPRLTNLMELTVDTSWWTRYRSRTKNPDFGDTFPQAIPSLAVGKHPAIPEVLRIVLSIGPTEAMHFQTWQDKAGNAPPLTDPKDPSLVFPNLNASPFGGEDFQTNLIMPEPTIFLSRSLPVCSIVRPTGTKGAAMGAAKFLTDMGLFRNQSPRFFALLRDLAEDADDARRHCGHEDE